MCTARRECCLEGGLRSKIKDRGCIRAKRSHRGRGKGRRPAEGRGAHGGGTERTGHVGKCRLGWVSGQGCAIWTVGLSALSPLPPPCWDSGWNEALLHLQCCGWYGVGGTCWMWGRLSGQWCMSSPSGSFCQGPSGKFRAVLSPGPCSARET